MDIEGVLGKIRMALQKLADNPSIHCSDCAKEMAVMPIRVETSQPNQSTAEWEVTNWSYAGMDGWYTVRDAAYIGKHVRNYCPDCAKKRALV